MDEVLFATKRMLDIQIFRGSTNLPDCGKYQKFYYLTNENVNGYTKDFNYEGKDNAITVLASGDHPFNLIHNGIINIDTFDVNALTEFHALGFKRASVLKYNYEDFEVFMQKIKSGYYLGER